MSKEFNENLWKVFKSKIRNEWDEKYSSFGSLDDIKHQTKFCRVLAEDIFDELKMNQKYQSAVITWNTLNIYFNQDGFGKNPKKKTLDIIERYLKNENQNIDSDTEKTVINYSEKQKNILFSRRKIIVFGFAFLFVLYILKVVFSSNDIVDFEKEKSKILTLIKDANTLEFNLYASVPVLKDTAMLKDFYISKSENKMQIIKALKRNVTKGNILDQANSSSVINTDDIVFETLTETEASVKTIEFWELRWIDSKTKKSVVEYVVANKQLYKLRKQEGKWLIWQNLYKGKAKWY